MITSFLANIFLSLIRLLFVYQLWIPIALILGLMIWRNSRRLAYLKNIQYQTLKVIPNRDKVPDISSAEELLDSIHGLTKSKYDLMLGRLNEHLVFEFVSMPTLQFYIHVPKHLIDYVEAQIYSQYPDFVIERVEQDYLKSIKTSFEGLEIYTTTAYTTPIKSYLFDQKQAEHSDPLNNILGLLSSNEPHEVILLQYLIRPVQNSWNGWQRKVNVLIQKLKHGRSLYQVNSASSELWINVVDFIKDLFRAAFIGPVSVTKHHARTGTTKYDKLAQYLQNKASKNGFEVKIRVGIAGSQGRQQWQKLQSIATSYKLFNVQGSSGFKSSKPSGKFNHLLRSRLFLRGGFILNSEELASIMHFPKSSSATPNIEWKSQQVIEPPLKIAHTQNTELSEFSPFAISEYRHVKKIFGIKNQDRAHHIYILGKSGGGKSSLLNLLMLSDIKQSQGFALIDPHGDLAHDVINYLPSESFDRLIYFSPGITEYPYGFNPLEITDPAEIPSITSEVIGVLRRTFAQSWRPRMEHILRFSLLALLESPEPTMLGLPRMLTDKDYRAWVVSHVKDSVVRQFWQNEFDNWNDFLTNETTVPLLNKVGQFIANPILRNILGQYHSSFNIREIMDQGKILIIDLSRGKLGDDNATLLGSLLITKFQVAAMSRGSLSKEKRLPFHLYVDEFQNFSTESFATILSEARKYGLYLTVANQYIGQINPKVKDAIIGNVGTLISFATGSQDAEEISKFFQPNIPPKEIIHLAPRKMFLSIAIDGKTSSPFSAKTLDLPNKPKHDNFIEVTDANLKKIGKSHLLIQKAVQDWIDTNFAPKIQSEKPGINTQMNLSPSSSDTLITRETNPDSRIQLIRELYNQEKTENSLRSAQNYSKDSSTLAPSQPQFNKLSGLDSPIEKNSQSAIDTTANAAIPAPSAAKVENKDDLNSASNKKYSELFKKAN